VLQGENTRALKSAAAAEKALNNRQQSAQQREALKPLREKLRKLEQQLEKDQARLAQLEEKLADPSLYEDANKQKLATLLREQGELKTRISAAEEEWLQTSEALG